MKRTVIPAFTVILSLLTASIPGTALATSTVDNVKNFYILDSDNDKASVTMLAENTNVADNSGVTSGTAITTDSAVTTSPSAVEAEPQYPSIFDYSKETTASLRMKPLKDKLNALTPAQINAEAAKYKDIKAHWSKAQDAKLSALEIIKGYSDGTFKPDANITVAEFVVMTMKTLGYNLQNAKSFWAQNYIDQAIKDKLFLKGYFTNYNRVITREEVALISVNALMQYADAPNHDMDKVVIKRLTDYNTVNNSLKQKVIDANLLGLMSTSGSSTKFMPKSPSTRAEAATLMIRLLDTKSRAVFTPKASEAMVLNIKGTTKYVVNNNKPEVITMANKIKQLTSKINGYVEYAVGGDATPDQLIIDIWSSEQAAKMHPLDSDMDIRVSFDGYTTASSTYPYIITVRNPQKVKDNHMDVINSIITMFYEKDADKVKTQFDKALNSAISADATDINVSTYANGVKYADRGIYLRKGPHQTEFVLWIYSK